MDHHGQPTPPTNDSKYVLMHYQFTSALVMIAQGGNVNTLDRFGDSQRRTVVVGNLQSDCTDIDLRPERVSPETPVRGVAGGRCLLRDSLRQVQAAPQDAVDCLSCLDSTVHGGDGVGTMRTGVGPGRRVRRGRSACPRGFRGSARIGSDLRRPLQQDQFAFRRRQRPE